MGVGAQLSVARGALHPHLLVLVRDGKKKKKKKNGRIKAPSRSLSPLFCAAGSLSEVMSHVSSFFCSQPCGTAGEEWWREGRRRKDRGRKVERAVCVFMWQFFCSWQILHLSVSASSICLLLACCSEEEKVQSGGPHGSHLYLGSAFVPLHLSLPPIRPSVLHSPLPALGFSLMTHSPPWLLLYKSRRWVSGSRQCSPATHRNKINKT